MTQPCCIVCGGKALPKKHKAIRMASKQAIKRVSRNAAMFDEIYSIIIFLYFFIFYLPYEDKNENE